MNRGLALGVFDLFHVGHLRYLTYAKDHCDELWVGVRGDALQTPGKKHTPMYQETQRLEIISALSCVDCGFVFSVLLDDVEHWVSWCVKNKITHVFVGGDWQGSPRWLLLEPALKQHNIRVIYAPRTKGVSSTRLRGFT